MQHPIDFDLVRVLENTSRSILSQAIDSVSDFGPARTKTAENPVNHAEHRAADFSPTLVNQMKLSTFPYSARDAAVLVFIRGAHVSAPDGRFELAQITTSAARHRRGDLANFRVSPQSLVRARLR